MIKKFGLKCIFCFSALKLNAVLKYRQAPVAEKHSKPLLKVLIRRKKILFFLRIFAENKEYLLI
jgi:hypothetical protein